MHRMRNGLNTCWLRQFSAACLCTFVVACGARLPDGADPDPGTEKPPGDVNVDRQRPAKGFYFNDFESTVGSEWSTEQRDTTPTGFRRYLGQFANDTIELTVGGLPDHTAVTLSFDVYVIGSWDGNAGPDGPNLWTLSGADGRPIFQTTFAHWPSATQAYPNVYPVGNNPARSGAVEINSLGYRYFEGTEALEWNAVYNMTFTLEHTGETATFRFSAQNLESPGSETWGLDNVSLLVTPDDAWETALVLEATDFVSRPVGGPFGEAWNIWSTGRITDWIQIDPACTRIRASGLVRSDPAFGRWPIMGILLNQRFEGVTTVAQSVWTSHAFDLEARPGVNQIAFCYTNDEPPLPGQDRNLHVKRLEIQVPAGTPAEAWPVRVPPPDEMAEPQVPATDAEVLELATANIEQYRKGDFHVAFVDPAGAPVTGRSVQAHMFRHAFKWGTALRFDLEHPQFPLEQRYRRELSRMFNYGTTEDLIRWGAFEAERGNPRFGDMDIYLGLCAELGVELKAHNVIWGHFEDLPRWLTQDDLDNAFDLLADRTRGLVGRYRAAVSSYDLVNEPLHALQWEFWAGPSYLENALQWAAQEDPGAELLINEYQIVGVPDMCDNFYVRMKDAIERGGPLGGVGIQLHSNLGEWYLPKEMWRAYERMSQLGVALHLTEVSLGAEDTLVNGGPYHGQPWNEELQAEYYEQVMRVAFGHPALDSVTFWGFTDRRHFQPGSGLLDINLQPKRAGTRYRELLQREWSTNTTLQPSSGGGAAFRGFYGWYRFSSGDRVGVAYLSPGQTGTPENPVVIVMRPFGDSDADGAFGESDLPALERCFDRSLVGAVLADCVPFDVDGDENVDCADYQALSPRYAGPGVPRLLPCTTPKPTVVAAGSKYLAITPPPGSEPVALRVTCEDWLCISLFVDPSGFLVQDAVFRTPAEWGTINVADAMIVPGATYNVQLATGHAFSEPASAKTWMWGDTNGDGQLDDEDLRRVIDAYHGNYGDIDFRSVDVTPCVPNRGVDLDDVTVVTNALNGGTYHPTCPEPCNIQGLPWDPDAP